MDDDRLETGMDLEPEEEPKYLRRQKRVEVRKRLDSRKFARLRIPLLALCVVLALGSLAWGVARLALNGPSFVLRESNLEINGGRYVARSQVAERFQNDIGKSTFAIRLEDRRASIEQIPWVERADIARLWPDRIRVVLH